MKYSNIREEELKNKVGSDFFADFDTTSIVGNIDFCVLPKQQGLFGHSTPLLRAEAKTGNYDVPTMFVQLILTIGKARTFDKMLPPTFLGAFDFQKFAFIEYLAIQDIFYENDFNWNVTPSNHETREFKLVLQRVKEMLDKSTTIFDYEKDEQKLRDFIKLNITETKARSKIKINRNNVIAIYNKWKEEILPQIETDWNLVHQSTIAENDFFLADLFVDDQNTQIIGDDESINSELAVIFENGGYKIKKETLNQRYDATITIKNKHKYEQFWKNYKRPPLKEFQSFIIERRDLLAPRNLRERRGAYFTPRIWVEKSQEYMAEYFGENYQDEYYIRDCAAGTGNLLVGLTNKRNLFASTLETADINVMKERAKEGDLQLFENHIFQFDFLNDSFEKLPTKLQEIINDPEKRKKLILYINPPYAETATNKTQEEGRLNKRGVSFTEVQKKYSGEIGIATKELFAQFLYRIYKEIPNCKIANFSTLKNLQGPNFEQFRECFLAKLEKIFIVPGYTFDNVKGEFPIGFFIWNCEFTQKFEGIYADIFDKYENFKGTKYLYKFPKININNRLITTRNRPNSINLGFLSAKGADFQNKNFVYILNHKELLPNPRGTQITSQNIKEIGVYLAVRHCIEADRTNDRDQFLRPKDVREQDSEFQSDCLIFTLFHGQNRITSRENKGINHRIPFTEDEIGVRESFESNFMSSYLKNLTLSPEALKVYQTGQALWTYYHQTTDKEQYLTNASLYEIREYFQGRNEKGKMNNKSSDQTYNLLIGNLRSELKNLASKIADKVYEYEFLRR